MTDEVGFGYWDMTTGCFVDLAFPARQKGAKNTNIARLQDELYVKEDK